MSVDLVESDFLGLTRNRRRKFDAVSINVSEFLGDNLIFLDDLIHINYINN